MKIEILEHAGDNNRFFVELKHSERTLTIYKILTWGIVSSAYKSVVNQDNFHRTKVELSTLSHVALCRFSLKERSDTRLETI